MFSSCIQYFVALSLLILRIRFQSILRIFLLKYPIRQEISFSTIACFNSSTKPLFLWPEINVTPHFFILYVFASSPPLLFEFIHPAWKMHIFSHKQINHCPDKKAVIQNSARKKHPSLCGNPQKEGCWTQYPVVVPITACSYQQSRY